MAMSVGVGVCVAVCVEVGVSGGIVAVDEEGVSVTAGMAVANVVARTGVGVSG